MASDFIQATPLAVTEAYYDLGTFSRKVSTNSVDAQVWFDRGLIWTYSFNHEEAANCFQQVIAHDPNCAMGYWGVAFVAGPNYNKKWAVFDEHDLKNSVRKGYHAIRVAEEHMISTMPFERALIKALRHRFPTDTVVQDFGAVDKAYSDAMRGVYWNFGETDMDVIALFADALMNTNPWGMYEGSTGKPILSTPVLEVKKVLEDGLAFPMAKEHPGILHMYIHLMEMSATPEVALVPADHLRDLVPDAGHLRHMPTHLDILIGDYRRSIDCNMKATLADDKFYERRGGKNFYSFYRLHNYHSLIYACMLAGQSGIALESIDRMETTITEDMLRIESPPMADWLEFFISVRVHVLIRFGLWEELKKLPIPEDKELYCVTVVMSHYGKAIAWATTGYLEEADKERGLFHAAAKHVPPTRMDFLNRVVDEIKIVAAMLDGELEYRRGNYKAAFASLRQATLEEDNLRYSEPGWMLPSRHAYAALLLEQDHVVEAAEVYAEDIGLSHKLIGPHRHPNNVWALHGYHECMTRLGRITEAQMIQAPLKIAMAVADIPIHLRLGAISRVQDFAKETPNEEKCIAARLWELAVDWPKYGEVRFLDTTIGYGSNESEAVLKNINLHIQAGQKVGLCGRTGNGKSSLALSVLRFNDIISGQILIDGEDLAYTCRSSITQRTSFLGQESFLFPGTIRQNADPQSIFADTDITNALRSVGLWDTISRNRARNAEAVLDATLDDTTLSQGQKQLFCLARALLKRTGASNLLRTYHLDIDSCCTS